MIKCMVGESAPNNKKDTVHVYTVHVHVHVYMCMLYSACNNNTFIMKIRTVAVDRCLEHFPFAVL